MRFKELPSFVNDHLDRLDRRYLKLFSTKPVRAALLFLFVLIGFLWAWCMMRAWLGNVFSPDSYCCFLLGKNLFDGFGFTTFAVRDLHEDPAWPIPSRSFPPLFPFLVGLMHRLTGMGIQSGVAVNLLVLLGTLGAIAALGRILVREYWMLVGFAFLYFFRFDPGYPMETVAARSIPVSILIFVLFLIALARSLAPDLKSRYPEALAGLSLCLLSLARFDQFPFAICAIPFTFAAYRALGFSQRQAAEKTGWLGALFALSYMPWAVRSMLLYGTPFASNNVLTVLSLHTGHTPISFWATGAEPQTLFTNSSHWLKQRLGYLDRNWDSLETTTRNLVYITPLLTITVWSRLSGVHKTIALLSLLQGALHLFAVSLTPYGDNRYWSQIHLNLCLVLCLALIAIVRAVNIRHARVIIVGVIIAGCLTCNLFKKSSLRAVGNQLFGGRPIPRDVTVHENRYKDFMWFYGRFIENNAVISPFSYSEAFTYYTGQRTVIFPYNVRNLATDNQHFYAWLDKWRPDYLMVLEENKRTFKSFLKEKYTIASREQDALLDARKILADFKNPEVPKPEPFRKSSAKKINKPEK